VRELLSPFGLTRIEAEEGLSGFAPGSPANYRVVARLYFETIEGYSDGIAAVGHRIFADIPNYTDIPIEVQVSRVLPA
jgi:uncharacterized protein (TIGR02118 family)